MRYSCALVLLLALHAASCEGLHSERKQTQQVLLRQEAAEDLPQYQESTGQMHDVSDDEVDLLLAQEEAHESIDDEVKEAGEEQSGEHNPKESYLANEEIDDDEEEEEDEESGQYDATESSLAQAEIVEQQEEGEKGSARRRQSARRRRSVRRRRSCIQNGGNCQRGRDCCNKRCVPYPFPQCDPVGVGA
jgi:glucan-binding YG repeat protein